MALIETEATVPAGVRMMKCTKCGRTFVRYNRVYEYCPRCGRLACSSIYESYFSTKSGIASNWRLLKDLLDGDLTFMERMEILNKPFTDAFLNLEEV